MDVSTIAGIGSALGVMITGILLGSSLTIFIDIPSVMIVVGGTIGACFGRFPLPMMMNAPKIAMKTIFSNIGKPMDIIDKVITLSETARKESILALEKVEIEDPFLKKGIRMAVDGKDPQTIKAIMTTEIQYMETRHQNAKGIFDGASDLAPAWGMIGTLIGLIQMLQALDDPGSIGPAMAVALITTFYGSVMANAFFIPLSGKLGAKSSEEILNMQIAVGGVLAILAGENPRIIREKIESFLPPAMRTPEEMEAQ